MKRKLSIGAAVDSGRRKKLRSPVGTKGSKSLAVSDSQARNDRL